MHLERISQLGGEMEQEQRVVVIDVNLRFGTMAMFLVKLAIAAISAAIIIFSIGAGIAILFGGFSGLSHRV